MNPDQLAKEALDVVSQAQKVFNSKLDPTGSIQEVKQKNDHLSQPDAQLTASNGQLLGDIKTSLLYGSDFYFNAEQAIRQWCGYVQSTIEPYIRFLEQSEPFYEEAKQLLSAFLKQAIESYSDAQSKIHETSTTFAKASSQLKTFIFDLRIDYDENSEYFRKRLSREEEPGGKGRAGGLFDCWFNCGSDKVDDEKVALLKAKLQNILDFYLNLNKDVENVFHEIQVYSLQEKINRLTNLKAQIDKAPATKGDSELISSARALDALCKEFVHGHP